VVVVGLLIFKIQKNWVQKQSEMSANTDTKMFDIG
jgi:hypothetical protein